MTPSPGDENSHEGADAYACRPVGAVLQTQTLTRIAAKRAARETLKLIDAIHQVSGLPVIPVRCTTRARQISSNFRCRPNSETGEVEDFSINLLIPGTNAAPLRLTASLLHEIGHAIDLLAFENRKQIFCSETHLKWNDWRRSVMLSEHVAQLRCFASNPPGRPGLEPNEPDYLFEAMAWRNCQLNELWARSYAQYIAVRNHHAELLATLREVRDIPDDDFPDHSVPRQWSDDDFAPIQDSIDQLFGRLGWCR